MTEMKRLPSIKSLNVAPRSIRWRYLFGLLQDMSDWDANKELMHQQRKKYEDLVNKYYHSSTALAIIGDTEKDPCHSCDKISQSSQIPVKVYDDPLSIIITIEDTKTKIEKEREAAKNKERVLASRLHKIDDYSHSPDSETLRKSNYPLDVSATEKRWSDFYSSREIMDLIEKDLDRLPLSHHICFHQLRTGNVLSNDESDLMSDDSMLSRKIRSKILSESLFVYAKKNSHLGYRQGMHEILSLVHVAVEQDLLWLKTSDELSDYNMLLDDHYKSHDSYSLFEAIMDDLGKTFEPRSGCYGSSITNIIKKCYGNEELATLIERLDVPTEVYCTRWTRLMFSREINDLNSVFELWDELFHQAAIDHDHESFSHVLETTAASLIILIEHRLQSGSLCCYDTTNKQDDNEVVNLLMNYPRIDNVTDLINTLKKLLEIHRSGVKKIYTEDQNIDLKEFYRQLGFRNLDVPHLSTKSDLNQELNSHRQTDVKNNTRRSSHPDQVLNTLQHIKEGHAWAKVSSGLKDAWQSFDVALQAIKSNDFQSRTQSDDLYEDDVVEQNFIQDHFEYRDLSKTPLLFREHSLNQTEQIEEQVTNEGHFIGGSNINHEEKHIDIFRRIDASLDEIGCFILQSGKSAPMNVLNAYDNLRNLCDALKSRKHL